MRKKLLTGLLGGAWLAHAEMVKEVVRHIYLTTSKQESTLRGFSPHLAGFTTSVVLNYFSNKNNIKSPLWGQTAAHPAA